MTASQSRRRERRQAYYSGHVQGVGFRYTVRQLAEGYEVTGFVRNLPDGRVELLVEGVADELSRFLDAVRGRMDDFIDSVAIDVRPAVDEFSDFRIRH